MDAGSFPAFSEPLKTTYLRDVTERNIIVRERPLCFLRQHGMMKSRKGGQSSRRSPHIMTTVKGGTNYDIR
jgi:hypothetical protein